MPEGAPPEAMGGFNFDSSLRMAGIDKRENAYNWMSDELLIFTLTNPAYNAKDKVTATNTPFYNLIAISSSSPDKGLDLLQGVMDLVYAFMGKPKDYGPTELNGYKALLMPPADIDNSMVGQEGEAAKELAPLKDAPPAVAVAVPGYLLIADKPSIDTALAIFQKDGKGTGRLATIETAANLDIISQSFSPTNPGTILKLVGDQSPEVRDLLQKLYTATRDIKELGNSRLDIVFPNTTSMELDVNTSRESIKFFEAVQTVIRETPPETWEKIGNIFQNRMSGEPAGKQSGSAEKPAKKPLPKKSAK